MAEPWQITVNAWDPRNLGHYETIFTVGNGYMGARGALEEDFPGQQRATFVRGVYDEVPLYFTELVNVPDWLSTQIVLDGERFSLSQGEVLAHEWSLDLSNGVLTRSVRWTSPGGKTARISFQRFASMHDEHLALLRCRVVPEFEGSVEIRAALNARTDNQGFAHWDVLDQGRSEGGVFLRSQTRHSRIELAQVMKVIPSSGRPEETGYWDAEGCPTLSLRFRAAPGAPVEVEKHVAMVTSRDDDVPLERAREHLSATTDWQESLEQSRRVWQSLWEACDVQIEGDDAAQRAARFNIFQMLIAAPRGDADASIPARTLSGFGYRGHVFWDTDIFMLPMFTFTLPEVAKNLLGYRWRRLPPAERFAQEGGYAGARFAWESADSGEEVTPPWIPDAANPKHLIRIWTGDLELHVSSDVAYAAYQYWKASGDDQWMRERGARLLLETAQFWASRVTWNEERGAYELKDVIGPDENHDHVDNNAFTNVMAGWNLRAGLEVLAWLEAKDPQAARDLRAALGIDDVETRRWRDTSQKLTIFRQPSGLIEQFEGYFGLRDVDMAQLEPRNTSVQALLGIEGAARTQVIKQPDVLMLMALLPDEFDDQALRTNYDYYTPRTDLAFGSSLGPAIQAILACRLDRPAEAYADFMRAALADLEDLRGNAVDGIHGASAGACWQVLAFGFGGVTFHGDRWEMRPHLPEGWKRLAFSFSFRGQRYGVEARADNPQPAVRVLGPVTALGWKER
jgi:kojibiose phosphorylase